MTALAGLFSAQWIWWTVVVVYALVILSTICVVVSENRNPVKSLAWVTVLLVTPGIGLILYIVFGRNIQNKRIISRRNKRKLKRLSHLGTLGHSETRRVRRSARSAQLIKLAESMASAHYTEGNAVTVFNNGTDKFCTLLADIASAKRFINLEYYIIDDDDIGNAVANALIERARAGVKVRFIYDHVGSFKVKKRFFKRLVAEGIEVHPFFRVAFPPFGTRINWRNHRKICVIDGKIGYIGGMNIADRYITGGKQFDVWRDLHLRVEGPAVLSLHQSFSVDWNFMGNPLPEEIVPAEVAATNTPVGMQLLTGGPTNQWMNLTLVFQKAISMARQRVFIQSPYFLPTEGLLHALQTAALSNVDVRIMMPRHSDSDMLRLASFSYIQECLRAGIKIYLYDKGMLHSKSIIIDDDFVTIGSTNFDFRSFEHNFEANMLIYSEEFNAQVRQMFLDDQADCHRISFAEWRRRPFTEKALESFMRLFSPIL